MAKLTIGHIHYLNCVPFFHGLFAAGFSGQLVSGVPAELNRLLQQGQLDVSPSSSFEYARHWQNYLLLPGHSISSNGKVHSVLLFSPAAITDLEGQKIAITGESATSINLLRIILREFYGLRNFSDEVPERPIEEVIAAGQPALLIGDRALKLGLQPPQGMRKYDLGEIWQQQTGLPFVFALWMIRRAALSPFSAELSQLGERLQSSLDNVLANPSGIAAEYASEQLAAEQIIEYWRSIDYRLEQEHLEGLKLFFRLCVKHQLLECEPPLDFYPGKNQQANRVD